MVTSRLIVIAGILYLAAFDAAAQPVPPHAAGQPAAAAPVAVSVRTDKRVYLRRDPIKLTFTVKNPSKSPVKLNFANGMKYDFEIRKGKMPSGDRVWQWSHGRMFFQMVILTTLESGKQLTYAETFAPGENGLDGKPIPVMEPGTYSATAILALSGRAPRPMARTTFVVK